LPALMLGALGVVYGDIGTSPLYALRESLNSLGPAGPAPREILGLVSAIIWLLTLVVSVKYVVLILRADNRGEGGIMALLALAGQAVAHRTRLRSAVILIGCFGACLFFGESILTPAISVLSAVEGLEIVEPGLAPAVMPIALVILVGLFAIQRHGTGFVGRFFGPVILLWFVVLAVVGVHQMIQNPSILAALNPMWALMFVKEHGASFLLIVGALVLAVTGVEALYADMGHFGRRSIRAAWLVVAYPALILNYLGQGALILRQPSAIENPFYLSFPEPLLMPAIILATMATVIASQATISGAYSATRQAIQLGLLPRMHIVHTSSHEAGQIYIPLVNGLLLVAVLVVTLAFGSSSALASAYGVSVTVTMLCSTILTFFVVRMGWGYSWILAVGATSFFLFLDLVLVAGCLSKVFHGGWFPLLLGLIVLTLMMIWKSGRETLLRRIREGDPGLDVFIAQIQQEPLPVVERTAVYLVSDPATAPQAMMHNIKHNMVRHRQNLIVTVQFEEQPWVAETERLHVEKLGEGFWRIRMRYGFKETPDVPQALLACQGCEGLSMEPMLMSYFLSRETVVAARRKGFSRLRAEIFASMARNAGSVVSYFNIPTNQVIELGTRVAM
jgi:KUP system potassium uptake protein